MTIDIPEQYQSLKTKLETIVKKTTSHWETIQLTNGTLYVNEANRICELNYSKTNVAFTSANTWTFVETVSQIANYPPIGNNNYYITATPTIITRVYASGSIQARNTVTSGSATVQFNAMWHY